MNHQEDRPCAGRNQVAPDPATHVLLKDAVGEGREGTSTLARRCPWRVDKGKRPPEAQERGEVATGRGQLWSSSHPPQERGLSLRCAQNTTASRGPNHSTGLPPHAPQGLSGERMGPERLTGRVGGCGLEPRGNHGPRSGDWDGIFLFFQVRSAGFSLWENLLLWEVLP